MGNCIQKFESIITVFTMFCLIFHSCQSKPPEKKSVQVGMNKQEVQTVLGEPARIDTLVKRDEIIWGAEEAFWDELPMETRLEIWIYESGENELRIYFIAGSDTLSYRTVSPRDAVYESAK